MARWPFAMLSRHLFHQHSGRRSCPTTLVASLQREARLKAQPALLAYGPQNSCLKKIITRMHSVQLLEQRSWSDCCGAAAELPEDHFQMSVLAQVDFFVSSCSC